MAREVGVGRGNAAGSRAHWFRDGHPGRKGAPKGPLTQSQLCAQGALGVQGSDALGAEG